VRHGAARAANALRALPIITYEACRVIKNQKNVRGLRLTPEPRWRVEPSVAGLIQVAGGEMATRHLSPFGLMALAVRHRLRTARMEAATGGGIEGIRHLPGENDPPAFHRGVEGECGGQGLRVRMEGSRIHRVAPPTSTTLPAYMTARNALR
jgi:hypothetical protein